MRSVHWRALAGRLCRFITTSLMLFIGIAGFMVIVHDGWEAVPEFHYVIPDDPEEDDLLVVWTEHRRA